MDKPTYKDEVYCPTENENWRDTQTKAKEAGFKFYCQSYVDNSENPFHMYPFVYIVNETITETRYDDLLDRDPFYNDAWKQYYDLLEQFSLRTEVRHDIVVHAKAWERGVELTLFSGYADEVKRNYIATGPRNVATMRELAQALNDACDFVEEKNPEWTKRKIKDHSNEE